MRQAIWTPGGRRGTAVLSLLGFALTLALTGCGQALYEQRLNETAEMYRRMQMLNENLQPEWNDGVVGLRAPLQFALIPGAASPDGSALDPRQPDYANIELLGLRAAFRADLQVGESGTDRTSTEPGYLYVLTNHAPPAPPKKNDGAESGPAPARPDPALFATSLMRDLAGAIGETKPVPELSEWARVTYPTRALPSYYSSVSYRSLTIATRIRGVPTDFTAYVHEAGPIQYVVLTVIPTEVLGSERIRERIDLSLETLNAVGGDPSGGGSGGGGAAL